MGDAVCYFPGAESVEERYVLTKDGLEVVSSDSSANAFASEDPTGGRDVRGD